MTVKVVSDQERIAIKEARARDAELAMRDYQAEKIATAARTQRLRALRLASEAQNELAPPAKVASSAKKAPRKPG